MNKADHIASLVLYELKCSDGFCRWWWDDLEPSYKESIMKRIAMAINMGLKDFN